MRVLWTARRPNQSILKEINPEYSLKGLVLKLKLQYFGYLMLRANSLEETLMAWLVKNPPAMWETWVRPLGWEDPLEKKMAAHSSILSWKIPWMEEASRLESVGSQRVEHD